MNLPNCVIDCRDGSGEDVIEALGMPTLSELTEDTVVIVVYNNELYAYNRPFNFLIDSGQWGPAIKASDILLTVTEEERSDVDEGLNADPIPFDELSDTGLRDNLQGDAWFWSQSTFSRELDRPIRMETSREEAPDSVGERV